MKLNKFISATLFTIGFGIAPHVHAHYVAPQPDANDLGALSTRESKNSNLESGEFDFVQLHTKTGKSFTDYWGFSLAADSLASISVFDFELEPSDDSLALQGFGKSNGDSYVKNYGNAYKGKTSSYSPSTGKLLDNKFLTFSLFDEEGNLVGSTGENGTLSNLALHGGEWYTVSVSAQIKGLFGSAYHGVLDVAPSAVPIGDSLPFFASALGLLALRCRKRLQANR